MTSERVWVTAEGKEPLSEMPNLVFNPGVARGVRVAIQPDVRKQILRGIGTSFTEASAFVLAHLPSERRRTLMETIFGRDGANFALARTMIASSDFSVVGKYTYAPDPKARLGDFSVAVDEDGFSRQDHPGIVDEGYDLLPMIQEALAVKRSQSDRDLRIVASAWTAPPWMKDIEDWYLPPSQANDGQGTGGRLKPEHEATYASYLLKYLDAYAARGVKIWGLTPVNEPNGNNGQWESMHFTPESERNFIAHHLGPRLRASPHADVKLLIYDQNRDDMQRWTTTILGDPAAAQYVFGTAVHWYSSTYKVYEDVFEATHAAFPDFEIIHTEGTIDDLGKPAPAGVLDPERFQEKDWFGNDAFWWNAHATDWAYTATWAPHPEDHPIYAPVHRYVRDILVGFNHWMTGWIDWNIVLDQSGGPNHVGNFCGAPIMIDVTTGEVYLTPVFHVLAQLSRTIRPGDQAVQVDVARTGLDDDALHASAAVSPSGKLHVQILNTTQETIGYQLQVGDQVAPVEIPANSLQTIRVQLDPGGG
jgi:glucosylceramidase